VERGGVDFAVDFAGSVLGVVLGVVDVSGVSDALVAVWVAA
jgi:hypothetical protein